MSHLPIMGLKRKRTRSNPGCVAPDAARSAVMRAVRQKGTNAELLAAAALASLGLKLRRNVRSLPGSPDFASKTHKCAVFVNGCFWHRHPGCDMATTPKTNREFWQDKFEANVVRDRRSARALRQLGYTVFTIWECETKSPSRLIRIVAKLDRLLQVAQLDCSQNG